MAAPASFPECMKGQHVNVFLRHYDCVVKVWKTGALSQTLVEFQVDRRLVPDLSVGESMLLEGHGYRLSCRVGKVEEVPKEEQLKVEEVPREEQLRISVRALNSDG